ncbi:melanopsin-like [Anneissia japonica]|uniref:melanopsin-like n=1 Tax=Anneissia japonica TaxID=1529436 RepID=UPI001425559A|nr:melanopsin-like [Anneissia japonica]XP_033104296.1 melanopsin-like [Anneissia japonica]
MVDNTSTDHYDFLAHVFQSCFIAVISIAGSIGNALVLVAMCTSSKLRNCTNAFIGNLAIADFFNCLVLPMNIVAIVSVDLWPLHDGVCMMSSLVLITCTVSSFYSLASVAYVRYIIVTKPSAKIPTLVNNNIAAIFVTCNWIVSLTTAFLPIISGIVQLGYDSKYHICLWDTTGHGHVIYSGIFAMIIIPIPLGSMAYFYIAIYLFIKKEAKKITPTMQASTLQLQSCSQNSVPASIVNLRKRNIDVTKNLFIVVLAFVICAIPHSLAIIIPNTTDIIPYTAIVFNCTSCINPLIYARKLPEYRRVISRMCSLSNPDAVHDISQ